jgi:hypothetical protein
MPLTQCTLICIISASLSMHFHNLGRTLFVDTSIQHCFDLSGPESPCEACDDPNSEDLGSALTTCFNYSNQDTISLVDHFHTSVESPVLVGTKGETAFTRQGDLWSTEGQTKTGLGLPCVLHSSLSFVLTAAGEWEEESTTPGDPSSICQTCTYSHTSELRIATDQCMSLGVEASESR